MAAPSAQTLQRLADETGHQPGTLEKVLRLLDLLQEIARDRVLADRLVLKVGRRSTCSTSVSTGSRSIST
ncbi:MAG: hypothetical protein OXK73_16015 [Rhodospirillaceae bacterium]|nr:hypothetical protein [Rhodospirillaceae bacterium]